MISIAIITNATLTESISPTVLSKFVSSPSLDSTGMLVLDGGGTTTTVFVPCSSAPPVSGTPTEDHSPLWDGAWY